MQMRFSVLTFLLTLLLCAMSYAQDAPLMPIGQPTAKKKQTAPKPANNLPPDKSKFAIIISGVGGEELYQKQFAAQTAQLRAALINQLGFAADQTFTLAETPAAGMQRATAEAVRQTFVSLRNMLKADQQLFVFFIGHGSFDGKVAKFNLVGPDLAASDYAQLINSLPTRKVVVANLASASGEFIKALSGEGHIVITATRSGMEQNATHFGEHFIDALENPDADADKNGRVSVLEAFNYAAKLTADFFSQKGRLATEHSLLDDTGDGTGHARGEEGEGALARLTYFDSLPQQQAGGDVELAKFFADRLRIEGEIEQIKAGKKAMVEEAYFDTLEKSLLELAKLNRTIKAKQTRGQQ